MQDKPEGASADRKAAEPSRDVGAPATPAVSPGRVLAVFTATTFLSALLLFSVQPMFAKMVLPILGGSPSVWAVAMVFFQATLLVGYCYAHLLIRLLSPWRGGIVHVVLSCAALLALPIGIPTGFGEPPPGDPALWQLCIFAAGVGLPFFAVSANAPLLQAWFAASGHQHARDPYFLYAASNLGSLVALLAYPTLLEPAFGVSFVARLWAAGFVALIAALLLSLLSLKRAGGANADGVIASPPAGPAPSLARRLGWVGLAFVPSALLTAFTTHITMDVASAPLLWVLPLSLYLLTFVLVFRDRPIALIPAALVVGLGTAAVWPFVGQRLFDMDVTSIGQVVAGIVAALGFIAALKLIPGTSSMGGMRTVHILALVWALLVLAPTDHEGWIVAAASGVAVFFSATMVAHRTLYETRPSAGRLTEYYLLMSLGGVLGGLFSALIAPRIFSQVLEYPILLALSVACRPGALSLGFKRKDLNAILALWLVAAAAILVYLWLPWAIDRMEPLESGEVPPSAWWMRGAIEIYQSVRLAVIEWGSTAALVFVFGLATLAFWRRATWQLVTAAAMCAAIVTMPSGVLRSEAQRSYFGVYRVYASGQYNVLSHGTTLHGAQKMRDEFGAVAPDTTPGTYYYPESPMARSIAIVRDNVTAKGGTGRFGVIGLGSGSLACHAKAGERWRIFEIDPMMIEIARNTRNFTYLDSCQPKPPDIALGDARLTLAKEPAGSFDIIIVDAFTSDAVPVHLMTAEALKLYLAKTSPNGAAVLHISNRNLDLDSVLGATVGLVPGAFGILVSDDVADGGSNAKSSSTVAIFTKSEAALAPFRRMPGVKPLAAKGFSAWTDDHSDILRPFLSRMRD